MIRMSSELDMQWAMWRSGNPDELAVGHGALGPLPTFRTGVCPAPYLTQHHTAIAFSLYLPPGDFHQKPTMGTFFFEHSPVIEEGYWRKPLDPTISMTSNGQFFKYFPQHVQPRYSIRSEESFFQYAQLSAELQLHVIQQCDASTLFQLMHTTRHLRVESKKLFFSNQATWYRLEAESLLRQPLLIESIYDTSFLASIEQLDLHCPYLGMGTWSPEVGEKMFVSNEQRSQFFDERIKANIKGFWCSVQQLCPQVKRVRLTRDIVSISEKHIVTDCYRKMAQFCPQGLGVFFYSSEPAKGAMGRRRKRLLWRLRDSGGDMAIEITPKREEHSNAPEMVVIPPEKTHRGHVGDFLKSHTIWPKYHGQELAAEFYRAAAVEQYYFQGQGQHQAFGCSVTNCFTRFEQSDQYTTHLLATGHGKDERVHEQVETLVAANTKRLQGLEQEVKKAHDAFWGWWGEYPSEQQSKAKMKVIDQLEHDTLYPQYSPVTEHAILQLIQEVEINMAL